MSIDIAKLVDANFAKFGAPVGVKACTLTKATIGIRMPGAISAGTNPTLTTLQARGLVTDFTAFEMQNSLYKTGDRKVTLFGASIEGGAVPAPNDVVAIDGETLNVVKLIGRDPAKATYILQCRA